MNGLDEFRQMLLRGLTQQTLGGMRAHEAMTPEWLKPYQPPEIPPGMAQGKIGPGEMNPFETVFRGAMDIMPGMKAAPVAAAAGGVGAKTLKEILKQSEHLYDIEKKIGMSKVTLPTMKMPARTEEFKKAASSISPETELPLWSSVPESARAAGYTVPAAHATMGRGDLTVFPMPETQLGAHFGTPRAAADRLVGLSESKPGERTARTIPSVLQIKNPLDLRDLGGWSKETTLDSLRMSRRFDPKELNELRGQPIQAIRDFLTSKGYDAIRYINEVESPGSISYIKFAHAPGTPRAVGGIRLPWARFEDLRSGDITSALAALGLTGTVGAATLKEKRLEQ